MGHINLRTLGIEFELEGHAYRDDGIVEGIWKHTKEVYEEFGLLDVFYVKYGPLAGILPDNTNLGSVGGRTVNLEKDGTKHHITFYRNLGCITTTLLRSHEEAEALLAMKQHEILKRKLKVEGIEISYDGLDNHTIAYLASLHVLRKNGVDVENMDPEKVPEDLKKALQLYQAALKSHKV